MSPALAHRVAAFARRSCASLGRIAVALAPEILGIGCASWLAASFVAAMRARAGDLSAPLDDTFIYFSYARELAAGHGIRIGPGEPFSSGATSWLYTALLVPGFWLGFDGVRAVLWAVGVNAVLFGVTLGLTYRFARAAAGTLAAWLAFALVLGSGAFAWLSFSGMDGALLAVTLGATVHGLDAARRKPEGTWARWGIVAAIAALSITRPEGLLLAVLAGSLVAVRRWRDRQGPPIGATLLGVLPGAVPLFASRVHEGTFATAGAQAKSLFLAPAITVADAVRTAAHNFGASVYELAVDPAGRYLPPLAIAFFLLAALFSAGRDLAARRLGSITTAVAFVLAAFALTMPSTGWSLHYHRYQLPLLPLTLAVTAVGIVATGRALGGRPLVLVLGLGALWLNGGATSFWRDRYAHNCRNIAEQQMTMAAFVRDNVPSSARIAVNDAGAIPYLAERSVYDGVGLITPGNAAWWREGPGAIFERFERLPESRRPTHFAVYREWWQIDALMGPLMAAYEATRNTICGGVRKELRRANWELLHTGERSFRRLGEPLDAIDHADLVSERAHHYAFGRMSYEDTTVFSSADGVADGGRRLSSSESWSVRAVPDRPLWILLRTSAAAPAEIEVLVDGRLAPERFDVPDQIFAEPSITIPAALVRGPWVRIDLRARGSTVFVYHAWTGRTGSTGAAR